MTQDFDTSRLEDTIISIGHDHGFENVSAEFIELKDLKIKWERTVHTITFFISDYIANAPEEVMSNLIDSLFRRIMGDDDAQYSDATRAWLTSEDFAQKNQGVYFKRCAGMKDEDGRLARLAKELEDEGATTVPPSTLFGWARVGHAAHTSMTMRTILISSHLKDASDDAVKLVILSQLLFLDEYKGLVGCRTDKTNMTKAIDQYIRDNGLEDARKEIEDDFGFDLV